MIHRVEGGNAGKLRFLYGSLFRMIRDPRELAPVFSWSYGFEASFVFAPHRHPHNQRACLGTSLAVISSSSEYFY